MVEDLVIYLFFTDFNDPLTSNLPWRELFSSVLELEPKLYLVVWTCGSRVVGIIGHDKLLKNILSFLFNSRNIGGKKYFITICRVEKFLPKQSSTRNWNSTCLADEDWTNRFPRRLATLGKCTKVHRWRRSGRERWIKCIIETRWLD